MSDQRGRVKRFLTTCGCGGSIANGLAPNCLAFRIDFCPKAAVKERKESLRLRRATFGRHRRPQTSTDPDVVLPLNRGQQNSLTGEIIKVSAANFVPKRDPFLFSPPLSHFSQSLPTLVGLVVRKGNTVQEGRRQEVVAWWLSFHVMP